jgi:hypothetical protein
MALQLPQQPNDPRVVLPQAPENPPVLSDVYRAVNLKRNVLDSAGKRLTHRHVPWFVFLLTMSYFIGSNAVNASTPDDVSRAVVYEHSVAHVAAGIIGPGL